MKSDNLKIGPLIIHPPPELEESVGKWIERLAKANNVRFDILFGYIFELCEYCGLYKALNLLTRVPVETISKMENEFKDNFWNDEMNCPIKRCEFSTNSHQEIVRHLKTYHNIGVIYYTCSMCKFKTRDKQLLKKHQLDSHYHQYANSEFIRCKQCLYWAISEKELVNHVKKVHYNQEVLYQCSLCKYSCNVKREFDKHLTISHGIGKKIYFSMKDTDFKCPYCMMLINGRKELNLHFKKFHYEPGKIRCPYCVFISTSKKQHRLHLRSKHGIGTWYICGICDFKTQEKRILDYHLGIEHNIQTRGKRDFSGFDEAAVLKYAAEEKERKRQPHKILIKIPSDFKPTE
ncbi:MAG TPA: hypothetical protein VKM55_00420 [Candidatus Lokiarchaeia archaeon]|nr:hypothetical protein [Candidatus Lokiarchaeia archaeon]